MAVRLSAAPLRSLCALLVGLALPASAAAAGQAPSRSIGLVIGDFSHALYETPNGKEECPNGYQHKQAENFQKEHPTPEAKKQFGETRGYYTNRGPNGENVFYFPATVKDPLPFNAAGGPKAYGLNLDGDETGKGGAGSLPHENFTSPDGTKGVDHQLFRVVGCLSGWRSGGIASGSAARFILSEPQARLLVEITDVDDEVNDPDVTVTTWRGRDLIATDQQNRLVPWLSQRIDYEGGQRYIYRTRGRIVGGVLYSDPVDVRIPTIARPTMFGERQIKKMRLQLKLTPTGADGVLGGYEDVEAWYLHFAKSWGAQVVADITGWSGPSTYQALKTYADYRDPATGRDAISAAYKVSFARVFIVHDAQDEAAVAHRIVAAAPAASQRTASR